MTRQIEGQAGPTEFGGEPAGKSKSVEVNESTSKPTRKIRDANKRSVAMAYRFAYKILHRGVNKSLRTKISDPNDFDSEVRRFVKSVIALAEQDDK